MFQTYQPFMKLFQKNTCYLWKGVDANGHASQGKIISVSKKNVIAELSKQGITPYHVKKKLFSFHSNTTRITRKNISHFLQQLSILINAHLPLDQSIQLIADDHRSYLLKQFILSVSERLKKGETLTEIVKSYPEYFHPTCCELIHTGEETGQLDVALSLLVEDQATQDAFKKKLKKSMRYPLILLISTILITIGMVIFMIPQFETAFSEFGTPLPWLTQLLASISQYIRDEIGNLLLLCLLIFLILRKLMHTKAAKFIHQSVIKLPLIGQMIQIKNITLWLKVITTSTRAGLSLHKSLTLAENMLHNLYLKERIETITKNVSAGQSLYSSMEKTHLFSNQTIQLIKIAENAGSLPKIIAIITTYHARKLETLYQLFSIYFETIIMLLLAISIGTLIVAMYLPVFSIGAAI